MKRLLNMFRRVLFLDIRATKEDKQILKIGDPWKFRGSPKTPLHVKRGGYDITFWTRKGGKQ